MYIHGHVRVYTDAHAFLYTCSYTRMYVCTYMHMDICTYMLVYLCTKLYITCTYTHVYVCIYTRMHAYVSARALLFYDIGNSACNCALIFIPAITCCTHKQTHMIFILKEEITSQGTRLRILRDFSWVVLFLHRLKMNDKK